MIRVVWAIEINHHVLRGLRMRQWVREGLVKGAPIREALHAIDARTCNSSSSKLILIVQRKPFLGISISCVMSHRLATGVAFSW